MTLSIFVLLKFLFFFSPANTDVPASIYEFKVAGHNGNEIDLAAYKGKKILIVNAPWMTADDPQYAALDELYKKYNDKLVVIGFLADGFGMPPGSHKEADNYRKRNYTVSFPLAEKVEIRGSDMAPIFKWLTDKKYNNFKSSEVKWNFQKYLINEQGALIAVFDPKVTASDPRIIEAIEK